MCKHETHARVLVDGQGRTWERGKVITGKPGVYVKRIVLRGNYWQVDFGLRKKISVIPPPVVLHADDVQAFES